MSIKQTMSTAIPADPNNVRAVVDEANDGKKAVPVELVLKRNDDSTFDQVNDGKSLPVADSAVLAKLSALEAKLDSILSGASPASVMLTGSNMEYYGATVENRPAANSVPVGAYFKAVQTQEIWQSDGTNWVEV